ncbi:hypothetical protein JZ751_005302 [Albula glossodonta]|uniref:Uncharacterized protein n=1 Tax=Albula glossodonta TaxID=121402 RepID=A0A8T2N7K9_9TELE|nr:hypothetical protein JZ751_005302 [Albula glossodonta]
MCCTVLSLNWRLARKGCAYLLQSPRIALSRSSGSGKRTGIVPSSVCFGCGLRRVRPPSPNDNKNRAAPAKGKAGQDKVVKGVSHPVCPPLFLTLQLQHQDRTKYSSCGNPAIVRRD